MNKIAVIVCGYGKKPTPCMIDYIESSLLEIVDDFAVGKETCSVIASGGDTAKDIMWRREAEMMKVVINRMIAKEELPKDKIAVLTENDAYNTLTNIFYSKRLLGDNTNDFDNIIVVCNEAHFIKNVAACFKIFGRKMVSQKVVFYTFPLTKRFGENIKTYFKTGFEVFGYFFRPFGRYLEYWQWRIRTGRDERLGYWQFRLKYGGELL